MSCNGFLYNVRNSVIKHLETNQQRNATNKEGDNRKIIWLQFPYLGKRGETINIIKTKNKKMLKERCKIYHLLQYEQNGNVLLDK